MFEFLGHLHPVLVHLPIGILLLACFFQLLSLQRKFVYLQPAIGITLCWGMLSAVAACVSGYILSHSGDYDEDLVGKHQWMGILVAVASLLYYLLNRYRPLQRYQWVLPLLLVTLVSITGHLGGSLTHGSDYLTSAFSKMTEDTAVVAKPIANVQEAVAYTDIIQPVLQSKCYSCHGANKQKGKLRMDQADLLMKGGKNGVVIEAGKADESQMIKRILLEKADEHHMPPKEKPQLTEKEVAILHWWIASGASFDKKTKDLAQTEKIKPILLSLQNTAVEKKAIMDVPVAPVEKADESILKKLRDSGIVAMPVSANSNYLVVNFVSKSNASDATIQSLLPLKKQLVWLKLNDTHITDAAAPLIAQCSNLTRLELANTGLTDKGIASLAVLQQLQLLNVVGTKVSSGGLLKLKDLKQLQSIYFYKTAVSSADWDQLKKVFPKASLDSGGYTVPLFDTDTMIVKPPKTP